MFKDTEEPVSFVYDNIVSLYQDQTNNLLLKGELGDLNNKDLEKTTKLIQAKLFVAKWNVLDGKKEIRFYLDSKDYSLLRAELDEQSSDESGKLLKQNLIFYITNINQDIKIEIPKI